MRKLGWRRATPPVGRHLGSPRSTAFLSRARAPSSSSRLSPARRRALEWEALDARTATAAVSLSVGSARVSTTSMRRAAREDEPLASRTATRELRSPRRGRARALARRVAQNRRARHACSPSRQHPGLATPSASRRVRRDGRSRRRRPRPPPLLWRLTRPLQARRLRDDAGALAETCRGRSDQLVGRAAGAASAACTRRKEATSEPGAGGTRRTRS